MITADLRNLDDKGLIVRRQELEGVSTALKFQLATGNLDNTAAVRQTRRDLARLNTVIREREQERGLHKGGLAAAVGALGTDENAFSAFRKHMGHE